MDFGQARALCFNVPTILLGTHEAPFYLPCPTQPRLPHSIERVFQTSLCQRIGCLASFGVSYVDNHGLSRLDIQEVQGWKGLLQRVEARPHGGALVAPVAAVWCEFQADQPRHLPVVARKSVAHRPSLDALGVDPHHLGCVPNRLTHDHVADGEKGEPLPRQRRTKPFARSHTLREPYSETHAWRLDLLDRVQQLQQTRDAERHVLR